MHNEGFVAQAISRTLALFLLVSMTAVLLSCAPQKATLASGNVDFDVPPLDTIMPDPPPAPEPEPVQRALISFAGDCCFSSMQGSSAFNAVYTAKGSEYFLSGVREIFANDDLTVVNLEAPFTNATTQISKDKAAESTEEETEDEDGEEGETQAPTAFWFKAPPEYVEILTSGSVEVCNLANNHILDYGTTGLQETQNTLDTAGVASFIWDTTLVKEVNGINIGFFGFSFDSNAYNIRVAMDQLRAEGAEVVVAYFHDGIERTYRPSASQETAAYAAIDYGASAVIMSHPHVIQGTKEYNGGFIAWSLGNFCYGGHTNPLDKDSMIVQLEFIRTSEEIVCTPKIVPCSITSTPGTNDYRPLVLTDTEAQRVLNKIVEISG